jgi:hypothetical protein
MIGAHPAAAAIIVEHKPTEPTPKIAIDEPT